MKINGLVLPKQEGLDTRCGAYCLAYYMTITQKAVCSETAIAQIYDKIQFQEKDIPDDLKNTGYGFSGFSNPIRMMKWLRDHEKTPQFYTGGLHPLLVKGIQNAWNDTSDGKKYNVAADVQSGSLPTGEDGWFIAIWNMKSGGQESPQHYVLYHRQGGTLTSYNSYYDEPKTVDSVEADAESQNVGTFIRYSDSGAGIKIR